MDIAFAGFTLKAEERLLSGPDGLIDIGAKAVDVLRALVARPHEVVSKDALLAEAWPGVIVEENALQAQISTLRKVLGPDMIVTVHGRGYKYAGPRPEAYEAPSNHVKTGEKKPVIAVLPFENLSSDVEEQYFSDGITSDIADRLTAFRAFAVIGQYSAAAFRGSTHDLREIRERLHADFVVTGSIRRAAGRIRIAVRLLEPIGGEAIWADRYDRPMSDLFTLQDEISELVAAALARHLEVQINVRNTTRAHASLTSYENMLQGYWHFKKLSRSGNLAARRSFERAVALDPGNAEAMGWLGVTYCEQWVQDFTAEHASKGAELSARAISIDPANAFIYAGHTWILMCVGDLAGAVRASERSMALNPGDPAVLINRSLALAYDGETQKAMHLSDLAHRLEPVPPPWFGEFTGVIAFADGRYEDTLRGVEALDENAWDAVYALACYGHLGEMQKARLLLDRYRKSGREPDWELGMSREAFRHAETRERLASGLRKALST